MSPPHHSLSLTLPPDKHKRKYMGDLKSELNRMRSFFKERQALINLVNKYQHFWNTYLQFEVRLRRRRRRRRRRGRKMRRRRRRRRRKGRKRRRVVVVVVVMMMMMRMIMAVMLIRKKRRMKMIMMLNNSNNNKAFFHHPINYGISILIQPIKPTKYK